MVNIPTLLHHQISLQQRLSMNYFQLFKDFEVQILRLVNIIRTRSEPFTNTFTSAKFLQSSELREFCRQYDKVSLAEVHNSFATMDRIAALIKKQTLLNYPEGVHFQGVLFEKQLHHQDPETVRNAIINGL
jgi:hypothetical protein